MRRVSGVTLALALAALGAAPAARPTPTPKTRSHGRAVEGHVVSVIPHRSFVVRTAAGEDAALVLTGATHLSGPPLAPGQAVAVRYLAREGKKVATSVRVEAGPGASPTATALASP
jgi:hypothetical protein